MWAPVLYLFTPPRTPSNCPDVPCAHVPAEIFTPGLLSLGATQSPPQMCPVDLDKEEHGHLITVLLSYRMALLRDVVVSQTLYFFSFRSLHQHQDISNSRVCNGIIKCVYRL